MMPKYLRVKNAATRKKLAIAATGIWHVPTITQKSIADNEKIYTSGEIT